MKRLIKVTPNTFQTLLTGISVATTASYRTSKIENKIHEGKVTIVVNLKKRKRMFSGQFKLTSHYADRNSSGVDVYRFIPNDFDKLKKYFN